MSYFKKTIKIIIIVVYLESTSSQHVQKILNSFYNFALQIDNLVFCNDFWYPKDFSDFKEKLRKDVIGQPFVTNNLIPILEDHVLKTHSKDSDPLFLSFHGPSGVGKSFVAEILSYAPFIKNKHLFLSKNEFSDLNLMAYYKDNLNKIIDSSIRDCEKSIFVFDDADSLPPGLIDVLNPFSNKKTNLRYGESIFIFIFQRGSQEITSETLKLLNKGVKREQFNIQEFRDIIQNSAQGFYSSFGNGLFQSLTNFWIETFTTDSKYESIFFSPVNTIIPFLPVEKEHVKSFMIINEYKASESDMRKIWDQLYFQEGTPFLSSGFKLVQSKLHVLETSRKTEF